MDIVADRLRFWRSIPLIYGHNDCMLSIGDYIADQGGLDVTPLFRGKYSTHEGALEMMALYGGASALVDMTGLQRTDGPQRGDVLVMPEGASGIGALCTGDGVALRLERGVIEIPLRFFPSFEAWKIK